MNNNLMIRRKKLKDLIPLIRITLESFPSWVRHIPFLVFPALVAEKNSKVAGFVIVIPMSKKGEIALMAIDKNHRGQNIGSELLEGAFEYFKSKGKKYCKCKIRVDNPRALNFYEKNGFKKIATIKRPILGDVNLAEKKLI